MQPLVIDDKIDERTIGKWLCCSPMEQIYICMNVITIWTFRSVFESIIRIAVTMRMSLPGDVGLPGLLLWPRRTEFLIYFIIINVDVLLVWNT
jgi:hypothetical protein